MDGHRKEARRILTDIPEIDSYLDLIGKAKLTDLERKVCDMKYLRGWKLIDIGEELGYSERYMKKIHGKALRKLTNLF